MIRLLGTIDFPTEISHLPQSLVAYLIIHGKRSFHRDELVDALALKHRKELRQALWMLGPLKEAFVIDGEFIGFNGYPTDVHRFEFENDLDAYQGPLLPGWQEDWVLWNRVRLDLLFFERSHLAMNDAIRLEDYSQVEHLARRMLQVDPLYTPALKGVIQSLEARGLAEVAARYKTMIGGA